MKSIAERIALELNVRVPQVSAAVALLDDKATVPFIARYRKEATGGLDDTQLRTLEERLTYLRDLEDRRAAVLKSIDEQGKLTPELAAQIGAAETKARLEDLYLPFKPKRRTKAQIAREAGLEPLAVALLANPTLVPDVEAKAFVDAEKGLPTPRPHSRVRAGFLSKPSPRTRNWSAACASFYGIAPSGCRWSCRQGRCGRQVRRLLQGQRTSEKRPVASCAGAVPRTQGGSASAVGRPSRAGRLHGPDGA
jgi:hypothetical protein